MKISFINRLHLGSILLILVGSLIGVLFFHTIQDQVDEANWVRSQQQQIQQILILEKLLGNAEAAHQSFWTTRNKASLLAYINTSNQVGAALSQLNTSATDSSRQIQQARQLTQLVQSLLQDWTIQDSAIDPRTPTDRLTDLESRQLTTINKQLSQMLRATQAELSQREKEVSTLTRMLTDGAVVATSILFVLALILTYFYAQEFKRHRDVASQLQINVSELEQLNQDSDDRNWVLTGTTTLNEALQNLHDPDAVARQSIQMISQYLMVPAAGFYACQDEGNGLRLNASVALPATATREYAQGEGLIGQAATRRTISVIKDVPGTYWAIQSGAGQAVAGQLVCVPLWYGSELKGVIELAYFQSPPESHLALLKEVAKDIAIVFSTVQDRQRKQQLLRQVQQQKEILENQQEELRQTNEELTRQAESLQASEEELRVQEEELRQTNAELEERNQAVEVARQTLIGKTQELEVASKYKSEFLANMSHELRTPLNSVLILANLLAENKQNNLTDKQIEYAHVIHKSGSDLLNLINDILDLSKIEAGKVEIQLEPTSVGSIVEDLQQLFSVVADQKGVAFTIQVGKTVPATITTDKQRLEQSIRNLLSNAFKFTPAKGSVTLSFQAERPSARLINPVLAQAHQVLAISVTDTGIGIPEDRRQLIFEAFQQADGSTSRKFGGTGLGLSITRELIRRLNGEIQLQSDQGKGSTFTLILPLTNTEELPGWVDEPLNQSVMATSPMIWPEKKPININQDLDDRYTLQKDDQVMLIIEDDPSFARIVRDFARDRHYKTIVATRGDEGLEFARIYKPSAIILDMQLPVVNGWEVLNELKNDNDLKHIPVHVISGIDDLRLSTDGTLPYVQKPVSQKDLDQIFTLLGSQLTGQVKKVLIQSGDYLKDDALRHVIDQRHFELACDYVSTKEEVLHRVAEQPYDCLIVDMGHDLKAGIAELRQLRSALVSNPMPVIIYIDEDLSRANELKLKKLSDVVIRESSQSIDRLMDELELFLYKVQEDKKKPIPAPKSDLSSQHLEGRKVLLVDDDMRNIFALSTLLEQYQMNVVTADNGREALELLQEHTDTDIVLMDIMMPEMDGYEATRRIRQELNLSQLPIIALTAKAMPGDREKVIEAGASDYIAKPVDKSQLFSLMRVWLSR